MATTLPSTGQRPRERYRLPIVAAGGPVTRALLVMQDADPDLTRIRLLRRSIANRIEADIALLDTLGGDADFEENGDLEPSLCGCTSGTSGEMLLPGLGGDDREHVNEDGGDIQDEPHDPESDQDLGAEEDEGGGGYRSCHDPLVAARAREARLDLAGMMRKRGRRLAPTGHGNVTVIGPCGSPYLVTGL